jgi:hemerythrin-like domain-containing protein
MHLAMTRDADRLVRTVDAGPVDAAALEAWWHRFRDVIVRHHEREDDIIWPALAAADPTFADDIRTMHHEHDELDRAMAAVDTALAALRWSPDLGSAACAAAHRFRAVLAAHLAAEEAVAFHRLAQRPRLWEELDERIVREVTVREAAFDVPWMHDALDAHRSAVLAHRLPTLARPLASWVWRPRYQRIVTAAHGARA